VGGVRAYLETKRKSLVGKSMSLLNTKLKELTTYSPAQGFLNSFLAGYSARHFGKNGFFFRPSPMAAP